MFDNSEFLKVLYEITGAENKAELARVLGLNKTQVGHWERGLYKPTLLMLSRIKKRTGRDLTDVVQKTCKRVTAPALRPSSSGEGPPEQKMQPHQLSPETLDLMAGVQEILDSGVETVVSALKASIHAFRLSARALRREGDRKRAKGAAAMGGQE